MRLPVAREGFVFFTPPLLVGLVLLVGASGRPSVLLVAPGASLVVLGLALVYFFRDPERVAAGGETSVVAPADGRVIRLRRRDDGSAELSIFLSPLDVHLNRAPVSGILERVEYRPGRYRPAYADSASHENEQLRLWIGGGRLAIEMHEITGVLVRRIVLRKRQGDRVERGERIGVMKFGSRIDLYLPRGVRLLVREGERVRGAETVLAEAEGT